MTSSLQPVGLTIVHTRFDFGAAVSLDDSISRPIVADNKYLYGLFGDPGPRHFLCSVLNEDLSLGRQTYARTKLFIDVPHDQNVKFRPEVGLSGLKLLGKKTRADFRKAFQALFCEIVQRRHGESRALSAVRAKDTDAGFQNAMLAFPDCITATMEQSGIIVAIVPMRVRLEMDLWVCIVAKPAVSGLLNSVATVEGSNHTYFFTHVNGEQEVLVPPVLLSQPITIDGRPGATWRRGKHHPSQHAAAVV